MKLIKTLRNYLIKFQKNLLLTFTLLSMKVAAAAAPIEIWECKEGYDSWDNILVIATVEDGRQYGEILVAGVTHKSQFQIQGFDRRWDFGLAENGRFKYAFVIAPNGRGSYYDFSLSKETKPNMLMHCRETHSKL
jgi:hypothetical protein